MNVFNPYQAGLEMFSKSLDSMQDALSDEERVPFKIGSISRVEKKITKSDVRRFANLSDDKNDLHTDPSYAKREGPFDDTVAHGVLVLGSVSSALAKFEGDIIIDEMSEISFINPVYVGDKVEVECEIVEVDGRRASIEFTANTSEGKVIEGKTSLFDAEGMDLE